jgi:hypothetical protein
MLIYVAKFYEIISCYILPAGIYRNIFLLVFSLSWAFFNFLITLDEHISLKNYNIFCHLLIEIMF